MREDLGALPRTPETFEKVSSKLQPENRVRGFQRRGQGDSSPCGGIGGNAPKVFFSRKKMNIPHPNGEL